MTDTTLAQRTGTTNELARNARLYIDNAATASQNVSLLDDPVTREAIELNVIAPLIVAMSERDATIARLTADNKALTAGETAYKAMLAQAEDDFRKAEAKLAKAEAELETKRALLLNWQAKAAELDADRDRLSAELAEAQKREEHAIKAIEEALGWHQTTHIHMALRSFLASKEASHAE